MGHVIIAAKQSWGWRDTGTSPLGWSTCSSGHQAMLRLVRCRGHHYWMGACVVPVTRQHWGWEDVDIILGNMLVDAVDGRCGGHHTHTGVGMWWLSLSLGMVIVAGAWTQVVMVMLMLVEVVVVVIQVEACIIDTSGC